MSITKNGDYQRFDYTGNVEDFIVPKTGLYKLEVFGASGGNAINKAEIAGTGGTGGYSVGYVYLTVGQTLYICAGGRGLDHDGYVRYYDKDGNRVSEDDSWVTKKDAVDGGYNGGGSSGNSGSPGRSGSGGGATHIALNVNRGVLANYDEYRSEILLVAGGGGGGSYIHADDEEDNYYINYYGGSGGGLEGEDGEYATHGYGCGKGGTQYNCGGERNQGVDWMEGCDGTFGQGGGGRSYAGGGGGGWYGGGCGPQEAPGGGGSGYIDGVPEIIYKGNTYTPSTTNGYNNGNGAAIITLIQNASSIYLGDISISTIYNGNSEIIDIKVLQ